ncbi:hypothetical protein [Polyangium fumosum]|uniref:Uncharacterized protein n=1 Tax=Polyangium fumosum TaxID=889272 RepID=A0A4U1J3F8_9BACT|nr:hypothetical protein [Polyangium fumosum]TKD01204.1 hypothetical protein E8A74_31890 [Polyangium fumosum]
MGGDYYRQAVARWEGTAHLRITSWRALWAARLRPSALFAVVMMAITERLFGPARLVTRMQPTSDANRFDHLAEIRRFGMRVYRGRRRMQIQPDGVSVQIEGEEALWPRLGRVIPLPPGTATVLDARRARYRMASTGQVWDIDFDIGPTEALSVLTSPWGRGEERLRRAGDPGAGAV